MKTKMILISLIGMIGVSCAVAQPSDKKEKKNKYGKVLFTKESYKDTTSELSYTVYEKMHRNIFGVKKEVVTVEYDLAKFIRENKDLNTGVYTEEKFRHACCTLKDDVTRSYQSAKGYAELNTDFGFKLSLETLYFWELVSDRLFSKEMWIKVKITDDSAWEQCNNIGEIIPVIEWPNYGGNDSYYARASNYSSICDNMGLILIALLKTHKLGYTSYPENLNLDSFQSACK